jgi:hypothetical protein
VLMRDLNAFLNNKIVEGGEQAVALIALFAFPHLGEAITIFCALGWFNGAFVELCDCPKRIMPILWSGEQSAG